MPALLQLCQSETAEREPRFEITVERAIPRLNRDADRRNTVNTVTIQRRTTRDGPAKQRALCEVFAT